MIKILCNLSDFTKKIIPDKRKLSFMFFALLIISLFIIDLTGCSRRKATETFSVSPTFIPAVTDSSMENPDVQDALVEEISNADNTDTEAQESGQISLSLKILDEMTLHEKICQMFVVSVSGFDPTVITTIEQSAKDKLSEYPVGGFIFMSSNLSSINQTKLLIEELQNGSYIPLLIATDEEGGCVNRIMDSLGTTYFDDMYSYRDDGADVAYTNAKTIAEDMTSLGFNWDYAPVADVWSNSENTVIGTRAYSDDYAEAANLIEAAVRGFRDGGVACTLKHFPGHGDTAEDSHEGTAYVYKNLEQLRSEELLSFQSGITAGADAVMVAHITIPSISDLPALFSKEIVTDLLRDELGFDGVVITDALEMGAITSHYTQADAAVMAVQAGVDMLLEPTELETMVEAIENAVNEGIITEERIDESVLRILIMKENWGLLSENH